MIAFRKGTLVLRDRFRLVRQLGEGGMGVVWEVEQVGSGARHAIKFVKEEASSALATRRLRREAEAAAAISHPNIVRVLEVAEDDDGAAAIVMELLDGESLGARLERGPLTLGQTAAILRPVVSALRAAHVAGVIHRDLKPDNVFLVTVADGSTDVCVLDFGVAKQVHLPADSLTVTGSIVGTPMYMSPEQAAGERGLDARTDVWSLAVIAFECLSGTTPVTADNYGQLLAQLIRGEIVHLATIRPSLPPDVLACVDGALVPRDRRACDFDAFEATLARHADAAIDRSPPRVLQDGSTTLRQDSRTTSGLDETQLATSAGVSLTKKPALPMVVGAALALVVGTSIGSIAYVQSRPATRLQPSSAAATTQPAGANVVPDLIPSANTLPSAPIATAAPSASASADEAPRRKPTARPIAPRASASSSLPASRASSGAGQERLPGGVGGIVPF